jgi:hypothetical protein
VGGPSRGGTGSGVTGAEWLAHVAAQTRHEEDWGGMHGRLKGNTIEKVICSGS